jgi:hypothetical protein
MPQGKLKVKTNTKPPQKKSKPPKVGLGTDPSFPFINTVL